MIRFREMQYSDVDAGLTLCRSAGWNQLPNDWNLFLELKPSGSLVAVDEANKVVGTVATIDYEDRFSWIGMVLVDPAKKRQGIGTALLSKALYILDNIGTIKLDATPAGREVYLKLGFKDEYTLSRMILQDNKAQRTDSAAKNMTAGDFRDILKQDAEIFGASRAELLEKLFSYYPDRAYAYNSAYCFGRKGYNFSQIGPVISNTVNDAIAITSAALNNLEGPVVLDVMHGSDFYQWLLSQGFTEQRKLIRMFKGTNKYPGVSEKQFAILGPEFG